MNEPLPERNAVIKRFISEEIIVKKRDFSCFKKDLQELLFIEGLEE